MSERGQSVPPDVDLVDAPYLDDAERAESEWLRARERDPHAPAPSPQIPRDHARLEHVLGNLAVEATDESWHDEVLKLAAASTATAPRRWWQWPAFRWGAIAATTAAAAVVVLLLLRPRTTAPDRELELEIRRGSVVRGDTREAAVGDHLIIRTRPRGASELRVYRADGPLVARCPGGPACTNSAADLYAIDLVLSAPVRYEVILVVGANAAPPESTLDDFVNAAVAAKARIEQYPIDVR